MDFQSSLAGKSGGFGNATVPNDAPIQPPQAFVDNIAKFIGGSVTSTVDISNQNITYLDAITVCEKWMVDIESVSGRPNLNASGNFLGQQNVDDLFADIVAQAGNGGYMDISGGTTPFPTGDAGIDSPFVIGAGNYNGLFLPNGTLNGKPAYVLDGGETTLTWHDSKWVLDNLDDGEAWFSTDNVATPWLVTTWQTGTVNHPTSVILRHPNSNQVTAQTNMLWHFKTN